MVLMILYLFPVIVALGLAALAGWSDFKGMTIPNSIVVFIIAAFVVSFSAAHFADVSIFSSLKSHLLAGVLTFAVTFIMFSGKMIGGGDSKLLSAYALWVGMKGLIALAFYMSLAGAVLGAVALYLVKKKPCKKPKERGWISRVQAGERVVPYGIPIAVGALAGFLYMGLLAPENISLFLMSK